MRIDKIESIKQVCTGCMACIDSCPKKCISKFVDISGFIYTRVDEDECINCGKCYDVCPIIRSSKNTISQHLYAAYAKDQNVHNRGSSGGIFEVLATNLINKGYFVCGAGFVGTKLCHQIVKDRKDLNVLLKSKYIQSDTEGIYLKIKELLLNGERVLFSGTPCQVSALKNFIPDKLREQLFLVDIICHGVPSQKVFDLYIKELEKYHKGKVLEFKFRIKDNVYKHSHGFTYKIEKDGKSKFVNGVYSQSSFYNAFKHYLIFRDSCYECKYATPNRVADITLGDFWGIENYDFPGNTDTGVSMVTVNSPKGQLLFSELNKQLTYKEFPVKFGINANHCFSKSSTKPKERDIIISSIIKNGYYFTARKYFQKDRMLKPLFWLLPIWLRKMLRKLRG